MPVQKAVDIMWLQPRTTIVWTWACDCDEADPEVPPPLYFWFIPLISGRHHRAPVVSQRPARIHDTDEGRIWMFEWLIANADDRELPLKIAIWTPLGAVPCTSES